MKSKTFCIYPFVSIVTEPNGDLGICCRSRKVDNVTNSSLLDAWNNDIMKHLRLDLLAGEKPSICNGCWRDEDIGIGSKRTRNNNMQNPNSENANFFGQEELMLSDGTMPIPPQHIEFRVNNLCNLKCRMCNPLDSTSWDDWDSVKEMVKKYNPEVSNRIEILNLENKPLLDQYNDSFYNDIQTAVPFLKKVDFSGGEPLTNPKHYQIIDMLMSRASEIELKYDTNFLNLYFKKTSVFDTWKHFKSVQLNVSTDGIGDVYDYVRSNGSYTTLKENLDLIVGQSNVTQLVLSSATSIYNVHDMPNVTRLAASYGAPHHMCKVSYPNFLSCQILPDSEKKPLTDNLTEFINEIPSIYQDQELAQYVISQYYDLITFLNVPLYTGEIIKDFIKYDTALNESRKTNRIAVVTRLAELAI